MIRFIVRRLASIVPVLFLVTLITFSLLYLVPGDPAIELAGEGATVQQVEHVRESLGLNDSFVVQYGRWIGGVATGDLGDSLFSAQTVSESLWKRLPVTLNLVVAAMVIAILLGVPAGIVSGVMRGRWADRALNLGAAAGVAFPNYFIAMLLIIAFVHKLDVLPATGYVSILEDPVEWFKHIILPAAALATATMAIITRQLRSSLSGVLEEDYIRTARAKGLLPRRVVLKHGLKNASIPTVTAIGTQVGLLVGGTAIIERLFSIPGLGALAIDAVLRRDLPVIQGIVLMTAVFVQLANLATDVAYGYLNPRIRMSS